jgi:hypothetical protein
VAENVLSTVIAASLISILLNSFMVRGAFGWLGRKVPEELTTDPVNRVFMPAAR